MANSEAELGRRMVTWLKEAGHDVYQEVDPQRIRGIADIVAIRSSILHVVEVKTSLSLVLLEQALGWKQYAHCVSIAIPSGAGRKGRRAADLFLDQNGIGAYWVSLKRGQVILWKQPKLRRKIAPGLKESLHEAQKTYADAGSADGKRWTPFAQTCSNIRNIVAKYPGIPLSQLMKALDHHYSSDKTAKACISQYLREEEGLIKGVYCVRVGREVKVYPVEKHGFN